MAALAVSLTTDCALALDKYLCIADKATGFHWTGTEWAQTTFKVDKDKYIVADLDANRRHDDITIGVTKLGDQRPSYFCRDRDSYSTLYCTGGVNMRVNLKSLRYMQIYSEGYLEGDDNNNDTPYIQIGRCSKI
jgi:hypothetical protein